MNIHDASKIAHYARVLQTPEELQKAAADRKGQIPKDRKSSKELLARFDMTATVHQMATTSLQDCKSINCSGLSRPYLPSTAKLDDLTPIFIKELRLETHHRGKYLIVRSLSLPRRITALMVIVEDQYKDAVLLQLYHQPKERVQPAKSIVKEGDVLLIKEPYFKITGDENYGIRVDHISDIIHINPRHRLWPKAWSTSNALQGIEADDWKQKGNEAIRNGEHWKAIKCYTAALECNPTAEEVSIIRLNRALAYLHDKSYAAALADTQYLDPNISGKALYRAGKALYGLENYSECCNILQILCEESPENADATKDLARARLRVSEEQSGNYDFKALYQEVLISPHMDHATFIGPVVVKSSPGRGQGLFTTRAVEPGELMLCEKALAHCFAADSNGHPNNASEIGVLMSLSTDRVTLGTQSELITETVQKIRQNPPLLSKLMTLYHGSYKPASVTEIDGKPVIDTFLIDRIIALNAFGCYLTSKDVILNDSKNIRNTESKQHSSGLWVMASKINHCCLSNVFRSFIGDLLIIRATRPIPADTELTFWYSSPSGDHQQIQKSLNHWGFQCECPICQDSKTTPKQALKKRFGLLSDFEAEVGTSRIDMAKVTRILKALGQTYKQPAMDIPHLMLVEPHARAALICYTQREAGKTVDMALKTLACLGFVIKGGQLSDSESEEFRIEKWGLMVEEALNMFAYLWNAYGAFKPSCLKKVAEYGYLAYKVCLGGVAEDPSFKNLLQ